jgi:uncharacterized repeat protein (TIGR02059 family)
MTTHIPTPRGENRKNNKKTTNISRALAGVPGFNESYYLEQNPDVKAAVAAGIFSSGYDHFNEYGAREARNPNPSFNAQYYLSSNPDVLAAITAGILSSAFEHYQKYGASEGRSPSKDFVSLLEFDYTYYITANPDLVAAGITTQKQAYEHYIVHGSTEGRSAKSTAGLSLLNGIPQAPVVTPVQPTAPVVDDGDGGGGDVTVPTFTSAATSNDGTKVILTYNEALSATTAATSDFVVTVAASAATISSVATSGSTVELTLSAAITSGQSVTVAYNDPSPSNDTNATQDTTGNDAGSLGTTLVTNNSTVPAPTTFTPQGRIFSFIDNGSSGVVDDGDVFTDSTQNGWDAITGFSVNADTVDLPNNTVSNLLGNIYLDNGIRTTLIADLNFFAQWNPNYVYALGTRTSNTFTIDTTQGHDTLIWWYDTSNQATVGFVLDGVDNLTNANIV